jgi:hypothetical protein
MRFVEIFIITIMAIIILMYIQNQYGEVEYVTSKIDNRRYLVRNLPDAKDAADLLALVNIDLVKLIRHMSAKYGGDKDFKESINFLVKNYNPNTISEGSPDTGYTSMTINKGEKLILCIRQNNKQFVEKNTIMYVAIHEIAHIMTFNETGHTPKFWDNFKLLLKEAVDIGIYNKTDYNNKPEDYCGIKITSSIN